MTLPMYATSMACHQSCCQHSSANSQATIPTLSADPALAVPATAHAALFMPACCLVCLHALPSVAQSLCGVMPRARLD